MRVSTFYYDKLSVSETAQEWAAEVCVGEAIISVHCGRVRGFTEVIYAYV